MFVSRRGFARAARFSAAPLPKPSSGRCYGARRLPTVTENFPPGGAVFDSLWLKENAPVRPEGLCFFQFIHDGVSRRRQGRHRNVLFDFSPV